MNRRGPQVNHLAFADDIILFSSGRKKTTKLLMNTLATYEATSGQLVNKAKSYFLLAPGVMDNMGSGIVRWIGMQQRSFPIKYLGCPLFVVRERISNYSEMISKVTIRIRGWHTRLLSPGGKAVLIKYILLALHVHLISIVQPPKGEIVQIEKLLAKYFGVQWMGQIGTIGFLGLIFVTHMWKAELTLGRYMILAKHFLPRHGGN